jgi:hypothetical protein
MKLKKLFLLLAIVIFTSMSNAQSNVATSSATATIIAPIGITKAAGVDMSFGNIAVTSTSGTVILAPDDTRTASAGVNLPTSSPGTITAASFDVTGAAGYTYSITTPTTISLTHTNTTSSMSISAITKSIATGTLDGSSGTQNIKVGGTLNVDASQLAGVYSNVADLTVTVNYN